MYRSSSRLLALECSGRRLAFRDFGGVQATGHAEAVFFHQVHSPCWCRAVDKLHEPFLPSHAYKSHPSSAFPDGRRNPSREHDHGDFFVDEVPIFDSFSLGHTDCV